MLSYQFYLVTHFIGIFLILVSLGGISLHVMNGGTRQFAMRKWAAIAHGIGLLLALVAGFGLLARLNIHTPWPAWVWVKLAVWLILGGIPALIYRQAKMAKVLWTLIIVFAALAAYMAVYKPGFHPTASPANLSEPTTLTEPQPPTPEPTPGP